MVYNIWPICVVSLTKCFVFLVRLVDQGAEQRKRVPRHYLRSKEQMELDFAAPEPSSGDGDEEAEALTGDVAVSS